MRILFAVHGYKPAWRIGGPIISVSCLAEALTRLGHKVIVFTSNSNLDEDLDVPTNQPVDVDGVEVWYFKRQEPLKRFFPSIAYLSKSIGFLYSPEMGRAFEKIVPTVDLVHTHLPFNYPTYAAAQASFRHHKPLFYHQRGVFDPARLKFRSLKKMVYLRFIEVPILKRATTLIALTNAEADNYRRLGVETPSCVIPNGITVAPYTMSPDPEMLRAIGIRPEHIVVLFLGRIHPIKGADRLFEAFLRVQKANPNAVLVMAGPDEFGIMSTFMQRVNETGLSERVIFTGMVQGELKTQLLARANLFCLPSDAEGFSMAILEALASSTAVLISHGCHFPEVEAAGAGRVVGTDLDHLSSALHAMLSDRSALESMGQEGRRLAVSHYSWNRITSDLLDVYEKGLSRFRAERPC